MTLSAPLVWILAPGVISILLLVFRRLTRLTAWFGGFFSGFLGIIAALIPIGLPYEIGPW